MKPFSKLVAAMSVGLCFAGAAQATSIDLTTSYGFDTDWSWGVPTRYFHYSTDPYTLDLLFSLTGDAQISIDLAAVGFSEWSMSVIDGATGGTISSFDNPTGAFDVATLGAGSYSLSISGNPISMGQSYFGINGLTSSSVTAVPEPETYAMLLACLGIVGAVARRRARA